MSLETQIIVALSLTLLILLFVMWKDRRAHREDEARLIQETLEALQTQVSQLENLMFQSQTGSIGRLQTQISQLENLVKALPQDNQKEINFLANVARQVDELQAEIVQLESVKRALTPIAFRNSPPDLPADNPYWSDLSDWIRRKKQWTCEKCCINLEDRKYDLHAHHILGRGFNSPQHLKVLCIECHAEEPGHGFMKASPEYEAFLTWKRRLS